jgi:hypothetical protein
VAFIPSTSKIPKKVPRTQQMGRGLQKLTTVRSAQTRIESPAAESLDYRVKKPLRSFARRLHCCKKCPSLGGWLCSWSRRVLSANRTLGGRLKTRAEKAHQKRSDKKTEAPSAAQLGVAAHIGRIEAEAARRDGDVEECEDGSRSCSWDGGGNAR